jgi:cellobiose dehydrogenase (acceptor)
MDITPQLNARIVQAPYLRDSHDKEAVIAGIDIFRKALSNVQGLTWIRPTASQDTTAFVNSVRAPRKKKRFCFLEGNRTDTLQIPATQGSRNSNHWVGTCKIGTDDGRSGGTAVVDLDTKVYGTDNLFVVDASIFPGITTGNPSAAIIIAAEKAAERILALKTPAHSRIARGV